MTDASIFSKSTSPISCTSFQIQFNLKIHFFSISISPTFLTTSPPSTCSSAYSGIFLNLCQTNHVLPLLLLAKWLNTTWKSHIQAYCNSLSKEVIYQQSLARELRRSEIVRIAFFLPPISQKRTQTNKVRHRELSWNRATEIVSDIMDNIEQKTT